MRAKVNKGGPMLDRQKLETILRRRFPGATQQQVAAAANAVMKLGDEPEAVGIRSAAGRSTMLPEADSRTTHRHVERATDSLPDRLL